MSDNSCSPEIWQNVALMRERERGCTGNVIILVKEGEKQ
jgi:hypothetical protein